MKVFKFKKQKYLSVRIKWVAIKINRNTKYRGKDEQL